MRPVRTISMIDIDAAGGIDPARLARALKLSVRRIGRGKYELSREEAVYHVDLIDPQMDRCDCPDFTWRQVVCQHLLACLLREGDERVVRAVARLVLGLREHSRQLRASVRGRTIPLTLSLKVRVATAAGVHVDDLDFRRDRTRCTSDIAVHLRATGELVGRVTRSVSRAEFVPNPVLSRHVSTRKEAA